MALTHNIYRETRHDMEHGGNIHRALRDGTLLKSTALDFSANINPLGPPAWFRSLVNRELSMVEHYPDPEYHDLREIIARTFSVSERAVIPANGSSELLHLLPGILASKKVLIPVPCYIEYVSVFQKNGFDVHLLPLSAEQGFSISPEIFAGQLHGGETVLFGNPVNPSGAFIPDKTILHLAEAHPDTLFVIDEAFHDFFCSSSTVGGLLDNIITLNSLTKFFAIPGLRVGFGIFPEPFASTMRDIMPPWSVNSLAQSVAMKGLSDHEYHEKSRRQVNSLRSQLQSELAKIPEIQLFESAANYLLLQLKTSTTVDSLYHELLNEQIIIRRCSNYIGLDDSYFRVAVRTEYENRRLIKALGKILHKESLPVSSPRKRAKTLMFQGTSSNAGKSVLAAAFCRILVQDGYAVTPFKAQNMSLNSHVTSDGGEMGRAQVVQAIAAKVEPDWRMNPVLLKPNSDTGSQVIIKGRPVGNMNVSQYHDYKEQAWKAVTQCFDELSDSHDIIILEGAGSPGEINLKHHDIVNMRMARYADSPVLLIGDIDRGGVYASFAGTMDVLEEWERSLIKGFVVNKFRGDISLLDDAHNFIKDHTNRDVLAVIPYMLDMAIPQEDSVSLREGFYGDNRTESQQVEIVVIDLQHISNFTDIDPLHLEPDVNVRFVRQVSSLGSPDAIILPGSKNVAGDLEHIRNEGFDQALASYADNGGTIVGICGGYQMLGRSLGDPHHIETGKDSVQGLNFIAIDSVLEPEKTLVKRSGYHIESGMRISGYEIHHGQTDGQINPVLMFDEGESCGSHNRTGSIWGTYLHGVFDEDLFRRWFIDRLRKNKNLAPIGKVVAPYDLDKSIDALADQVRSCFDMKQVYQLIGL